MDFTGIGACLGAGLIVFAAGWGISRIGMAAVEATARQPEAGQDIRMSMIIATALVEGVALFGVVICLLAVL